MTFMPSDSSVQPTTAVALVQSSQHTQSLALFKHAAIEDVYVYAGKEEHTRHLVPFICRLIKRHRFRLNIHQVQPAASPRNPFSSPGVQTFLGLHLVFLS
jgi:hypothetical protein